MGRKRSQYDVHFFRKQINHNHEFMNKVYSEIKEKHFVRSFPVNQTKRPVSSSTSSVNKSVEYKINGIRGAFELSKLIGNTFAITCHIFFIATIQSTFLPEIVKRFSFTWLSMTSTD